MGIFDIFSKPKMEVVNVDKRQPEQQRIIGRIVTTQLTRTNQQIDLWRKAISNAESKQNPNRTELIRTYNDIKLDNHLSALMQTRTLKIQGHEFKVVNADGELNQTATDYFRSEWFSKFIQYSMESKFEGHSLIQFGGVMNDKFQSIEIVPREYVVPEKHGVMKSIGKTNDLVDYTRPPFSNWLIEVGDRHDMGLLVKACPFVIWKKNALGSWAEFTERFGQPTRIGKTDSTNAENRAKMEEMLDGMGSNGWAVFDESDELMFIESSKSDPFSVFNELVDRSNKEMSKLIAGNTMSIDDGSSRSQSEVHERIQNDYFRADIQFLTWIVNDKLIPFMKSHGFVFGDGDRFKYEFNEVLSLTEQFSIDKQLLSEYEIEPEYFTMKYGTPIKGVKPTQIFGYHIENGIVQVNDVRRQLGLEEIDETAINERNEIKERLEIVQRAVQSGIPISDAVRLAGLDIENIEDIQTNQNQQLQNVFFNSAIQKYYGTH